MKDRGKKTEKEYVEIVSITGDAYKESLKKAFFGGYKLDGILLSDEDLEHLFNDWFITNLAAGEI
jgi:hypothetical protein